MSIPGSALTFLGAASGASEAYEISRSLRFNSADSAYLDRTPSSAGNRRTWTWSGWIKRSKPSGGGYQTIFSSTASNYGLFYFNGTDSLELYNESSGSAVLVSTQVFRDFSAWYHFIFRFDTTESTAADRLRVYVNGAEITSWSTDNRATLLTQNLEGIINSAIKHEIGGETTYSRYLGGYLADIHFIDGQALPASYFGEFDANNVWQAKEYSGTYGTNGFYLDFSDNSSTTNGSNTGIGKDTSGNGNYFNSNSLTVESPLSLPGVDFDGSGDYLTVPADADNNFGTGDFTMEWYQKWTSITGYQTIWSNNYTASLLVQTDTGTGKYRVYAGGSYLFVETNAPQIGKWHHYALVRSGNTFTIYRDGVANGSVSSTNSAGDSTNVATIGQGSTNWLNGVVSNFRVVKGTAVYTSNFTRPTAPLTNITNTVLLCCQSDTSTTEAAVSPGTITSSGDPTAGTFSDSTSANDSLIDTPTNYEADSGNNGGNYATLNPLHSTTLVTLSNGNLDCVFSPSGSYSSAFSTIGMTTGKWYFEATPNTIVTDCIMGISSDTDSANYVGYTSLSYGYESAVGAKYNNAGFVSTGYSTYSAGDIISCAFDADNGKVYFAKNGTWQESGDPANGTNAAFSGLTDTPYFFGVSNGNNGSWSVNFGQRPFDYTPPTGFLPLMTTSLPDPAIADGSTGFEAKLWTGNGSSQTITGYNFSPDFVWIKARGNTVSYQLLDSVRGANEVMSSNSNSQEFTYTGSLESFNSDGFDLGNHSGVNYNNYTYLGWGWDAGSNGNKTYTVKVVNDSGNKYRFDDFGTSAVTLELEEGSTYVFDQSDSSNSGHPLRFSTTSDGTHGGGSEYTAGVTTTGTPGSAGAKTTIVVASGAPTLYYYCSAHSGMGGQADTNSTAGASNFDGSIQATVRANPTTGFSIITYTGNDTAGASVGHELNATPEFVIAKGRDVGSDWLVYHKDMGASTGMTLNSYTDTASTTQWDSTAPDSTKIYLGGGGTAYSTNGSARAQLIYCWTPVEGYSALGTYTGTSSTDGTFVYTGFRPAWIILKGKTGSCSWYCYDNKREGYNPDNEHARTNFNYNLSNSSNFDILSNGFKLRANDAQINSSSVEYIWFAIAEHPFKTARAR